MPASARSVNAWLLVGEDDPPDTTYFSPNSAYQSALRHGVYRYVTMLNIAFFETVPVGKATVPSSSSATGYTIQIQGADVVHPGPPGNPTTQQYFEQLIKDARAQNPGLPLLATLNWGDEQTLSRIFSSPDTIRSTMARSSRPPRMRPSPRSSSVPARSWTPFKSPTPESCWGSHRATSCCGTAVSGTWAQW